MHLFFIHWINLHRNKIFIVYSAKKGNGELSVYCHFQCHVTLTWTGDFSFHTFYAWWVCTVFSAILFSYKSRNAATTSYDYRMMNQIKTANFSSSQCIGLTQIRKQEFAHIFNTWRVLRWLFLFLFFLLCLRSINVSR